MSILRFERVSESYPGPGDELALEDGGDDGLVGFEEQAIRVGSRSGRAAR